MHFLSRCLELALRGAGRVSPNPLVGAVLVQNNRIIGEGWHEGFGQPHAEVNAVAAVAAADRHLIPESTLYCNLEPCFHTGKTPPCVDLILKEKIKRVVICNTDPNPLVAGQSIQKMQSAGIEVVTGLLENEGRELNRCFFTWMAHKRPYVVLKWAESADGVTALPQGNTRITGPAVQRLVHRWRSESDAILVGTNTAVVDNPRLDNRLYPGKTPLRIALDWHAKIPLNHHLLDDRQPTWIVGPERQLNGRNTRFLNLPAEGWISHLTDALYRENKAVLFVEGGANIHQQLLEAGIVDEIRVLKSPSALGKGIAAPAVPTGFCVKETFEVAADRVAVYRSGMEA